MGHGERRWIVQPTECGLGRTTPDVVVRPPLLTTTVGQGRLPKEVTGQSGIRDRHQGRRCPACGFAYGLPEKKFSTGKPVTYNEIFIFRFAAGRVVETRSVVDVGSQMKQIGVVPASLTPGAGGVS